MPKIDLDTVETRNSTTYPMPFAADMSGRFVKRIGAVAGFSDFGVSHVRLQPGGISSQRHWHDEEDEFVVVIEGEAVLVENAGETVMRAGDCAVFPKGVPNGHQLINRSDKDCLFIAVGRPPEGHCHYSDVDLDWDGIGQQFTRKDGTPYADPGAAS